MLRNKKWRFCNSLTLAWLI